MVLYYNLETEQNKNAKNNILNFSFVLVEPTERIFLDHLEVDFVANQIANVVDSVLDHCGPEKEKQNRITLLTFKLEIIGLKTTTKFT